MSKYDVNAGTLFEDFEAVGDWTITGGTATNDSTIFKTGTESLKLVSGSGTNCIATKTISQSFTTSPCIYFWVYAVSVVEVASIQIILSSTSDFSKFFSKTFTGQLHEGWNRISLGRSGWSNNGGDAWANTMIRLRVRVNGNVSQIATVYFDSLYMSFTARPKVIISFDDGWDSQYIQGHSYIRQKGFRGSCYLIEARLNTTGYMTTAQVQEMHANGWDMMNHTVNHNDMTAYTYEQALPEITDCRDWLRNTLGFQRNIEYLHLAYPFGGYNVDVLRAMTDAGMLTGRTIIDRSQAHVIDAQYLLTRQYHDYTMSQDTYRGFIDRAIADNASVQINYHKIVADSAGTVATEVEISQFQDMLNYLDQKRAYIDVVTFTEWYRGLTNGRRLV